MIGLPPWYELLGLILLSCVLGEQVFSAPERRRP